MFPRRLQCFYYKLRRIFFVDWFDRSIILEAKTMNKATSRQRPLSSRKIKEESLEKRAEINYTRAETIGNEKYALLPSLTNNSNGNWDRERRSWEPQWAADPWVHFSSRRGLGWVGRLKNSAPEGEVSGKEGRHRCFQFVRWLSQP